MSKVTAEQLRSTIQAMLDDKKAREEDHKKKSKKGQPFVESVELQIGLRDYDPERDKRFTGAIRLPSQPYPNRKIALIGTAAHCQQAAAAGIPAIDADALKKFNKDKKLIKKWAKPYHQLIASESIVKQIPKLAGNVFNKINKFPISVGESENVAEKVKELKSTVRFQLKKVLCMGTAVGTLALSEEQLRQNINMSVNFLVSLLKKGWQNVRTLHIKTTQGKPFKIYP